MADLFDFFTTADEPPFQPTGALDRVRHFGDLARQGRLDALEALRRAEAEVGEFLRRTAAVRDAEVRGNREGLVRSDPRATSARAARSVEPRTGNQRGRILVDIVEHAGATDYELEHRLGMLASSVRPRRGELVEGGYLVDSGRIRRHQGTEWTVWEASPSGRAWYLTSHAA